MPYRVFRLRSRFGRWILIILTVLVFIVFINLLYGYSELVKNSKVSPNIPDGSSYSYKKSRKNSAKSAQILKFESIVRLAGLRHKSSQVCKHPRLSLFHDALKDNFHEMAPLVCSGENLFYFNDKGVISLNESVKLPDISMMKYDSHELPVKSETLTGSVIENIDRCHYNGIERVTDDYFIFTETVKKNKPPYDIMINHDFISIRCFLNKTISDKTDERREPEIEEEKHSEDDDYHDDSNFFEPRDKEFYSREVLLDNHDNEEEADFDQFLVQIYPKSEVFERISKISPSKDVTGMNVLIIGLDSLSHLSYQRKLPNTYRYLRDYLDMVILESYNIVGDATTAALLPLLTGKTETELPEVRMENEDATNVDVYPLIWKDFKKNGYVTLFAEDEPTIGAFNLRFSGFDEQPTDHYMRTFWLAVWASRLRENSQRFCTGNVAHHNYSLEYLKEFFSEYKNVSKFGFVFLSELTHWNNNPGEYIDLDLMHLVQFFHKSGYLDNTVLMMMSDHGARFSQVRHTVQGKLEERLPMFSVRFPPKFFSLYPELAENLQNNAKRLTTPFDVYETLQDVLNISRTKIKPKPGQRGISLLQKIPLNRTCSSAHIDMHWCTCLIQDRQEVTNDHVQRSANEILHFVNQWTDPVRSHCVKLKLKKVLSAFLLIPNEKVLRYLASKDHDNRVANFTIDIHVDIVHHQITIETYPNDAIYEATVMTNVTNGNIKVYPEISRLNVYGNQPSCVQKRYPDLRKYCYCINHLQTSGTTVGELT